MGCEVCGTEIPEDRWLCDECRSAAGKAGVGAVATVLGTLCGAKKIKDFGVSTAELAQQSVDQGHKAGRLICRSRSSLRNRHRGSGGSVRIPLLRLLSSH